MTRENDWIFDARGRIIGSASRVSYVISGDDEAGEMPQDNCDTGRTIYASKAAAEKATGGKAKRCDRCKGWHGVSDRPKSRRGRRER